MLFSRITQLRTACTVLVVALVASGCATGRQDKPVQTKAALYATLDANPDSSGRASPIVVRIFQLRNEAEFVAADFFALYDREKETLGATLLMREEYILQPGERKELLLPLAREARYVGAIAAFRDLRGSKWRALNVAPKKTMGDTFSKDRLAIGVNRSSIALSVKD
jgi:type VI secretion system protein VasD